ncbi:hypothetical protein [Candidatus Enterovibrio altilux]
MLRVKKLLGGTFSLRDRSTQVNATYAIIKVLNRLARLGMPTKKIIV